MIHTLRRKFIGATMLSLLVVLLVIMGAVNILSLRKTVQDADGLLALLSENQGAFPKQLFHDDGADRPPQQPQRDGRPFGRGNFSPETPFETRFFFVTVDETGAPIFTDISSIAAIDTQTAQEYAASVLASKRTKGFLGDYRYLVSPQDGATRVIFLDCGRSLSGFKTTLLASLGMAGAGLLGVFILLLFLSGRIVKPLAESYEKQRQFITNAGHEIKTPLTIISADADLLELEWGESEWLSDIRRQAQRLTDLTKDLIYLSRMDEAKPRVQFVEFPVSDVVEETAQSFQALATQQGRQLHLSIQEMLSLEGSEKDIRQLTSILLDNALKYAPPATDITLRLEKEAKTLRLSVENAISQPMTKETLSRLFDRFYRVDSSRNSSTGGYGLGLAIASGIVTAHKGKIRAESPDGKRLVITAAFPLN